MTSRAKTGLIASTMLLLACGGGFEQGAGGSGGASSTHTSQGGFSGCQSDAECDYGKMWCEQGFCVVCDNAGLSCDLACTQGWSSYQRNGCQPCDCAPPNNCISDADCPSAATPAKCYAGTMCWDWCPPGDPSCCFGNVCSDAGCSGPNPAGCLVTGCVPGKTCVANSCAPGSCTCDGSNWQCTDDCSGGVCAP